MVSFTSRARLIKPAETGEIVDVAQLNANMDKIDENLGVNLVTSTTRPTDPFPGMLIRETNTKQMFSRSDDNLRWEHATASGYRDAYEPGFSDANLSSSPSSATIINSFNFGPAGEQDLFISGFFAVHFSPLGSNNSSVDARVVRSNSGTSRDLNDSNNVSLVAETFKTADTGSVRQLLFFQYLLGADQADRYLKFMAYRTNVSTEWQNGVGLAYSLSVQPVVENLGIADAVPGFEVVK